jgi:hypothetical protein
MRRSIFATTGTTLQLIRGWRPRSGKLFSVVAKTEDGEAEEERRRWPGPTTPTLGLQTEGERRVCSPIRAFQLEHKSGRMGRGGAHWANAAAG